MRDLTLFESSTIRNLSKTIVRIPARFWLVIPQEHVSGGCWTLIPSHLNTTIVALTRNWDGVWMSCGALESGDEKFVPAALLVHMSVGILHMCVDKTIGTTDWCVAPVMHA